MHCVFGDHLNYHNVNGFLQSYENGEFLSRLKLSQLAMFKTVSSIMENDCLFNSFLHPVKLNLIEFLSLWRASLTIELDS